MPFISPGKDFYSLSIQKRYGLPDGFGAIIIGFCRFGDDDWRAAVYQKRMKRKDFWTKDYQPNRGNGICKIKYYYNYNPRTDLQQANRNKFGDGMRAWQNLTTEQKKEYSKNCKVQYMTPMNKFISQYCKSH